MDDQGDGQEFTAAPHPRYPLSEQFVLAVRGDSMNDARPFPILEGAFVKCVSVAGYGRDPKDGQIVIVHKFRDDGGLVEATIKRMRIFDDRFEFRPESTNARHIPIIFRKGAEKDFEGVRIVGIVLDVINRIDE
jgi:SOS-response transcriptional repressor LexA